MKNNEIIEKIIKERRNVRAFRFGRFTLTTYFDHERQ